MIISENRQDPSEYAMKLCKSFLEFPEIVIQLNKESLHGVSWSYDTIIPFPVLMILFPVLKLNAKLKGEHEKHFVKEVIWSGGLARNNIISCLADSISCFEHLIWALQGT